MKRHVAVAVLLCVLAFMYFFWRNNDALKQEHPRKYITEASTHEATEGRSWIGNSRVQMPPYRGPFDPSLPQAKEWNRRTIEDPTWEFKTPISFFGRVVDLEGRPIEGAKVSLKWSNLTASDGVEKTTRFTDANGKFDLRGTQGRQLTVSIEKEGYHELRKVNQGSFEYAQFHDRNYYIPDEKDPVLFRLQKQLKPEALYVKRIVQDDIPPNASVGINFPIGAATVGVEGDIVIAIQRPHSSGGPFDYTVEIRGGNGWQFQATNEEFPTLAPEGGYQSALKIEGQATNPNWRHAIEQTFYIRRGEGELFGVIDLRIKTNNNRVTRKETTQRCGVQAELKINPTGSRVLEYDPSLRVPTL